MKVLLRLALEEANGRIRPHHPKLAKLRKRKDYDRVITVLAGMGLLTSVPGDKSGSVRFELTPEGLCYFEKQADYKRRVLVNSVLLPIAVAFVTALITSIVSNSAVPLLEKGWRYIQQRTVEVLSLSEYTSGQTETISAE